MFPGGTKKTSGMEWVNLTKKNPFFPDLQRGQWNLRYSLITKKREKEIKKYFYKNGLQTCYIMARKYLFTRHINKIKYHVFELIFNSTTSFPVTNNNRN